MMVKKLGKAALKGKDVHHVRAQRHGGATTMKNLKVISVKRNRGWKDGV